MKILRVFPRRTSHTPKDDLVFIGDPPLERPDADEVHVSCTFTWDIEKCLILQRAWNQYYPEVRIGGPAFNVYDTSFRPGMYVKEGITITSRGCNNQCPWCLVPRREGKIKLLSIQEGNILQDNNILQCPKSHTDKVFQMLRKQKQVVFSGGLDARLLKWDDAEQIRTLSFNQLFLACDTENAIKPLQKAIKLLQLPRDKVRCYVLLKFDPNETIDKATSRLIDVWEAGALPFAQLYQPPDKLIEYPKEWVRFARIWQRPAATKAYIKALVKE